MNKFLQRIFTDQPLIIIVGGLLVAFLLVMVIGIQMGRTRQEQMRSIETQPIQPIEETEFSVRKITLEKVDGSECVSVNHNGLFEKFDCDTGQILDSGYLGFDAVKDIFSPITADNFDAWETGYFGGDTAYVITIETTAGTKTITTQPGDGELPSELTNLIETIEDAGDEILTPTPPPTPTPTSPPTVPTPTPTPLPTASPTPSPTPLPPGATPEPFNCSMLDLQGRSMVVSNIVCLP